MKTTSEARKWTDNLDSDLTDETWRTSLTLDIPTEIPASEDAVVRSFSEASNDELSSKTTPLVQKKKLRIPLPLASPKIKKPEYAQEILQDWEGVVETIGNENFTARLRNLTNNEPYPSEAAELPIEDISADDLELLRVGAVFYLTVGRLIWFNGRQERFGRIVFRRLPGWTLSTLRRAEKRAEHLSRFLDSED